MPRMHRKDVLSAIRLAGYHGDTQQGLDLYIKNRVSLEVYRGEFRSGEEMRQNGVPCTCSRCKKLRLDSDREVTPQNG